jgi:crotonobetainyl-CoA:carnitine CoA-transferase CaiB-like acyl-CoA transferase
VQYQTFHATDGPLLIRACNDRLFARLGGAPGVPEWTTDARSSGNRARLENRDELIALINARIGRQPRDVWIARLTEAGVPCGPVNTIPEVLQDPQVAALDILQRVRTRAAALTGHRATSTASAPRSAPRSAAGSGQRRAAPANGRAAGQSKIVGRDAHAPLARRLDPARALVRLGSGAQRQAADRHHQVHRIVRLAGAPT